MLRGYLSALVILTCIPVHAEPQVWMGSGQVVSGQGQGAAVQLVIETNGSRIRTHSGPHLDAVINGQPQTFETDSGTWHIEPMNDQLGITLYRGDQIIRYLLHPTNQGESNEVVELTNGAENNGITINNDTVEVLSAPSAIE